jgi:hypothetical protein
MMIFLKSGIIFIKSVPIIHVLSVSSSSVIIIFTPL